MSLTVPEMIRANELSWDFATRVHNDYKWPLRERLLAREPIFVPEEIALLGDLREKEVLHPMCNDGREAVSMALMGAQVVGVDISQAAITFAESLERDIGMGCEFVCREVVEWLEDPGDARSFDIVYVSPGSIWWVHNLGRFMDGVKRRLRHPSGLLKILEFHPCLRCYEDDGQTERTFVGGGAYCAVSGGVENYWGDPDNAMLQDGRSTPHGENQQLETYSNPYDAYEFQWTMDDVLASVNDAGMKVSKCNEYQYTIREKWFASMRRDGAYRFYPMGMLTGKPMMFAMECIPIGGDTTQTF